MKVVGIACVVSLAGAASSLADGPKFKVNEAPLYQMEAPLASNVAGSDSLNVEILRDPSGDITQLDLLVSKETTAARRCPCVTVSINPFICVTVPCGGGTFSVPDVIVFQEMEPSSDMPRSMRVSRPDTGEQIILTLPALIVGEDGSLEMEQ
ncbi:hypothetical protein [uncultured Sulfitobacter sp.]|uniref:hypothetical protein n=1 Tax=uncultured Sulfitobacter sp. TaxID=191468 RepID=UPI00263078DB|nr:hypothetical protein [uncultured Sulfitobacter sp.]